MFFGGWGETARERARQRHDHGLQPLKQVAHFRSWRETVTLAIAAEFPWGPIGSILRTYPGITAEQGMLLATDIRFTFGSGSAVDDRGRKFYPVPGNAAVVCAGDAIGGRVVANGIRDYCISRSGATRGDFLLGLQASARVAWARRRHPVQGLYLLFGICSEDGKPTIIRMMSSTDFAPLFVPGVCTVGDSQAEDAFRWHLGESMQEHIRRGNHLLSPFGWSTGVAASLDATLHQPDITRTVGGRVQLVILTKDGLKESSVSSTSGDPSDEKSWRTATIPLADANGCVEPGEK